jgi:hypothetical protein
MSDKSTCDQLAAVLASQNTPERKLVDVKFYVGNPSGVATERLCEDVLRLHMADGVVLRTPQI